MTFRSRLPHTLPVVIIRRAAEALLAAIVASYAVIICLQVFYRYVLNDSLVWSEELVRYGLLWGVMIGAGVSADRGAHVALAPLEGRLAPRAERVVAWAAGLCILAFCAIVAIMGVEYIQRLWFMSSPAMQLPMRYVFLALPVGAVLTAFFVLVHLIAGTGLKRNDPLGEVPAA